MTKLIISILLLTVFNLFAVLPSHAEHSSPGSVTEIRRLNTSVILYFEEEIGCNAKIAVVDATGDLQTEVLSMAMAAMATGYKLRFRYISCSNAPWPNVKSEDIGLVKG